MSPDLHRKHFIWVALAQGDEAGWGYVLVAALLLLTPSLSAQGEDLGKGRP